MNKKRLKNRVFKPGQPLCVKLCKPLCPQQAAILAQGALWIT